MKQTKSTQGDVTRRNFLSGTGAVVAGALLSDQLLSAQQSAGKPAQLIDVHHHIFPPYAKKLELEMGGSGTTGLQKWTPEVSLRKMDQLGLSAAMLSMSNWHGDALNLDQRIKLCRECNDFGAKMVSDKPKTFGLFASLMTLPEIDPTLKEIDYAYSALKADGIGMMSHYGEGVYIGDPSFNPILEELNRRKSVVFVHPRAVSYELPEPAHSLPGLTIPEYLFDTTRGILSLLSTAAPERYPDIKWVFAHAAGTAPYVLSRVGLLGSRTKGFKMGDYARLSKAMGSFYYDLTNSVRPANVAALRALAPVSHFMYGTDIPQGEGDSSQGDGNQFAREMKEQLPHVGFSEVELRTVAHGNAEVLFPRLKGSQG